MLAGQCDPHSQMNGCLTSGPLLDNGLPAISLFVSARRDGEPTWNWLCRASASRMQPGRLWRYLFRPNTAYHRR